MGSATIAALARGVNTPLTATTMGAEKFHLAVTIDRESPANLGLRDVFTSQKVARRRQIFTDHFWRPRQPDLQRSDLQCYCHVGSLKMSSMSDFRPPAYVSTLLAL